MEEEKLPANPDNAVEVVIQLLKQLQDEGLRGNSVQRLEEAAFFLSKMIETYKNSDFSHHMTAFIMISRSVLWILKKEYSHVKGFKEWHNSKKVKGQQEKLFKKITKLRNQISKVEPLKFVVKADFIFDARSVRGLDNIERMTGEEIIDRLSKMYEGEKMVIITADEAKKIGAAGKGIGMKGKIECMTFEHEAFQDILKECKLYFLSIAVIVFECVEKFGFPSMKKDH